MRFFFVVVVFFFFFFFFVVFFFFFFASSVQFGFMNIVNFVGMLEEIFFIIVMFEHLPTQSY